MVDFFKFKESLEEAKVKQAKKPSEVYEDELEKDADDPCWDGYVQLGTKMKNGKEVPNCVPMEEAKNHMKKNVNESKVTDDHWAIVKQNGSFYTSKSEIKKIVKPSKNPPSQGTIEKHGADGAIRVGDLKKKLDGMRNTDDLMKQLSESYYDYPDYGPIGASEMKMTQLHFIKYAADEILGCLESGCVMPEWYQNKLAKVEGEVEGLLSYMKGKKAKMKSRRYSMAGMYAEGTVLTESKTVEVSTRDARKANDIASDMFRGEYKTDGSNSFVFKKADAADDFRAELEKQKVELMEAQSGDKEAYTKFFNSALKKFGVKSPAELKGEKEKEFYDYVDKNWKSDDEMKNESVQINEKNIPLDKLRKGKTYTIKMNGKKGKVKVDSIRPDGVEVYIKMTYMDNNIGRKGQTVTQGLVQGGDDDVFMESYITEKLKPSDDVSTWIEDFYKSDAPQFKGKDKEERREMAVAAWLEARREAGYDVDKNPKD